MVKIGIVILNYLNWKDTIECIDSLKFQNNKNFEVVVVDNHSKNNSYNILQQRYQNEEKIHIINNGLNVGYAKGNNLGIQYCIHRLGIKNVLVINNDTVFKDKMYLDKISQIEYGKDIGAIGTRIIGSDNKNQNPIKGNISTFSIIKKLMVGSSQYVGIKRFRFLKRKKRPNNKQKLFNPNDLMADNYFLHGSAILLTENYLNIMGGFFPETFLYYEENILAIIMSKMKLKMMYVDEPYIHHKEDQSSLLSFNNNNKVQIKYELYSILKALKLKFIDIKVLTKKMQDLDYLVK